MHVDRLLLLLCATLLSGAGCGSTENDSPDSGGSPGQSGRFAGAAGASGKDGPSIGRGGTTNSGGAAGSRGGTGGSNGGTTGSQAGAETSAGRAASGGQPAALPKFVGNITTSDQADAVGLTFSSHWDQITPENAGKWGSIQSNASAAFNWSRLDAIYDYAQKNGIAFKEHTFVWGNQQPSGALSEAHVKRWISEFCTRYPNTRLIDVVNEPPPHTEPSYASAIGGGTNGNWQWIINSFKWAREACPNAILILNDYNNIEWERDHEHFVSIVQKIKASGAPIDAVGAQAHDLDGAAAPATAKQYLERLHRETGLPVYITEFDISADDATQLRLYQEYMPFFLNASYIPGITIWGWIYGKTWSPSPQSGLVRDGKPRPAMTWLMQQLGRPIP